MKAFYAGLAALFLLSSCTTYQLRAPGGNWLKEADRAVSVTQGAVTLSVTGRLEPELRFQLTLANQGSEAANLSPDQISVFSGDGKHWTAGRVIPADDVVARQKARSRTFEVMTTQPTRYRRTTTVTSTGTTTIIVSQPEPVVEVTTTTVNTGPTAADLDRLRASLWTLPIVPPKATQTGWLYAEAPEAPQYKLVVTLAGKTHELVFERIAKRVGPLTPASEWY